MAYLFELAADCGCDPGKASVFGQEFDGVTWMLTDGSSVGCSFKPSDIWQASDHRWWCRVVPDGVSATGAQPRKVSTTPLLVEVAHLLYGHLMRHHQRWSLACQMSDDLKLQPTDVPSVSIQVTPSNVCPNTEALPGSHPQSAANSKR